MSQRSYFQRHKRQRTTDAPRETCPLCGESAILVQDHCHTTGLCRDRICTRCNVILGRVEYKPERLQALQDYIARWGWEHKHGGVPYIAGKARPQ